MRVGKGLQPWNPMTREGGLAPTLGEAPPASVTVCDGHGKNENRRGGGFTHLWVPGTIPRYPPAGYPDLQRGDFVRRTAPPCVLSAQCAGTPTPRPPPL